MQYLAAELNRLQRENAILRANLAAALDVDVGPDLEEIEAIYDDVISSGLLTELDIAGAFDRFLLRRNERND